MKFWTIEDLRNPKRVSGFNRVGRITPNKSGKVYYEATLETGPKRGGTSGATKRGPCRKTPEEAAQDYCDYANGLGIAPPATLKTAGHQYTTKKVRVPSDIEAARGMIRDFEAQRRGDAQGYVYAITDGEFVKIGYSVNPRKRVAELQTGNARLLSLLGTIPGTESDERKLHAKYEHLNVLQEWFEIDPTLLSEFTQPAAMQQAA